VELPRSTYAAPCTNASETADESTITLGDVTSRPHVRGGSR